MKKDLINLNASGIFLILVFFCFIIIFGFISTVDTDKTVSEIENRNLAKKPAFTLTTYFDGTYTAKYDEYYSDTFPARDFFMGVNRKIKAVFTQFGGKDDVVIIPTTMNEDDYGGEAG